MSTVARTNEAAGPVHGVAPGRLPEGGWWPRPEQRELLRAVLLDREDASAALGRWRGLVDLDDIDVGSFGILPLLARRLSDLASDHADDARIRGVHRQVWARNQLHLKAAEHAVEALGERGIPAMVLKGVPLAVSVYDDVSARLMADVDVLVPAADRLETVEALTSLGWTHTNPLPASPMFRAAVFDVPGGSSVDLQWRLLQQPDLAWYDDECRSRAQPLTVRGTTTMRQSTPDLLFHVLVHGAKANPVPPLRWVTDAMAVISEGLSADEWDVLIDVAERTGLILPVRECLHYLVALADAPVPPRVLVALDRQQPSMLRRAEHRLAALPVPVRHRTHAVTSYFGDSRRLGTRPSPWGFVAFAKAATGSTSIRQLIGRAVRG